MFFTTGFQTDAGKFFIFTLTIFMVGFCAAALGWLFSATVSVFAIANLLIALCYVFMMVRNLGVAFVSCIIILCNLIDPTSLFFVLIFTMSKLYFGH